VRRKKRPKWAISRTGLAVDMACTPKAKRLSRVQYASQWIQKYAAKKTALSTAEMRVKILFLCIISKISSNGTLWHEFCYEDMNTLLEPVAEGYWRRGFNNHELAGHMRVIDDKSRFIVGTGNTW